MTFEHGQISKLKHALLSMRLNFHCAIYNRNETLIKYINITK